MGYDIRLCDPVSGETLQTDAPHHMKGSTFAVGGTTEMCLSITYNYSGIFHGHVNSGNGIRSIYGRTGAETIPIFQKAISTMGDETDPDYWKPTPGNVKRALCQLMAFAQMRPDGVWQGD